MTIRKVEFSLKPNRKIIDALRETLRDAKAGRVQAVGIAVAATSDNPDADAGRCTETILIFTPGWSHALGAAVNGLAFRLNYERYTAGDALPEPTLTDEDE